MEEFAKREYRNYVHPIEVKSWKNVKHNALDKFKAKYSDWLDVPYLLWDRDVSFKDGILHLPLYMAPLL